MVFGDPFSTGSKALPMRLADAVLPGVPVCGGLLSGASQAGANVLVADDQVSNSGAVGLVLEGDIEVESVISHGTRGVGPSLVVTEADASGISELAGRPAASVLDDLLASLPAQDRTTLGRTPLIGIAIDATKSHRGRGDFLVRPIAAIDRRSGTLLTTGRVPRGSTIQFHVRDAAIAADDLDMSLDLAILDDRPPAGILLAGSAGRGASLFGASGHDSGRIHERLGEPPLVGFEAAAEIASIGGRPRIAGLGLSAMILRGRDMRRNPSDADR
jgi:small ligand-binding sensory domain FIST